MDVFDDTLKVDNFSILCHFGPKSQSGKGVRAQIVQNKGWLLTLHKSGILAQIGLMFESVCARNTTASAV